MDERIVDFLEGQKVAMICCVDEESKPYCFSCFYAFDKEKALFYFKSSASAHHSALLRSNPAVAGGVQPDKLNPLAIKGIQFTGSVIDPKNELSFDAAKIYHKKFPFALAMPGEVWTIQSEMIKLTDNSIGFGKKTIWRLKETVN